ncbi:MAG: hypothetical protein GY749_04255 [Desulfobacteraceae bacterium]|nr:hypothetical protein [Desulfobacteraceae bacterium]
MQTYKTEKSIPENGILTLDALPFNPRDFVEITIKLRDNKSQADRYPLRGKVLRYGDPTEPVAQEDWDILK